MKFIAVSVKTLYEWKKTIDIFYKMGYCWNESLHHTTYFPCLFDSSLDTNILVANYCQDGTITFGYVDDLEEHLFTFQQFVTKYGAKYSDDEELE